VVWTTGEYRAISADEVMDVKARMAVNVVAESLRYK